MYSALAVLAAAISVAGFPDSDVAYALHGEVPMHIETVTSPQGKAAGRGSGMIIVERPIAEVWATVSRFEDKAEYMPRIKSVAVLDKKPDVVRVRMEVDASVTTARYTAFFQLDEAAHRIHWKLDHQAPDNTIADVDGEYRLLAVTEARTLVVYSTWVDSGRAVPRFIQDYATRKSIPNLLKALKQRVESGGVWKKKK